MIQKDKLEICHKTISSRAFYQIVIDAIDNKKSLSTVRAADGEKMLMDQYINLGDGIANPPGSESDKWLDTYGIRGITRKELYDRILLAGSTCDYFAPSVSGLSNDLYNLYNYFPSRDHYVDNFFCNDWTTDMKSELFKKSGHVLLIHGNPHTADSMQIRVQANLKVKVSYLKLTNWSESINVIERASKIDAPLVIFSGGPSNKYISNEISKGGNIPKVVLDIGAAAQHWTFENLPADRKEAEKFHKEWIES